MAPTYAPPPPARRRRRWPIVLLVLLLVLIGLFVAADRIALGLAEDKAASALQSSQNLPQKPDVSVEGFPFLTQLLAGNFGEVVVTADDVPVGDNALNIQRVTVDLHDVTVSNNYSTVHAKTATAQGRVGYDELSQVLKTPVRAGSNDRLVAQPTVHVLGQSFHGTISAHVHASSAQGITFTDPQVSVGGVQLPPVVAHEFARVFEHSVSLAGLPFGVRVTGADVTPSGLVIQLTGHNLTYRR
jgi:LmeA-like phospholipid-binding